MKIGILICAYNEEKHIKSVVNQSLKYCKDVIVVNDGSRDNTLKEIKKTKAKIINLEKNKGKGAALKAGFSYGFKNKYDYFILLDGDGQHSPSEIPKFVKELSKGYDIVIGSRKKRHSGMPYIRRASNFSSSLLISAKLGKRIKDTQSGYRAINLNLLKGIKLKRKKYDLESEILLKMIRKGAKVKEIRIKTIYGDELSKINPIKDAYRLFRVLAMDSK
ncbi:glycosyltransferase family 2 protein [Candidatus Pacearchaeota archaeon]|nr:glycosyltransferase family 2 protein [Candidatus Pacearchaeota archaeon]